MIICYTKFKYNSVNLANTFLLYATFSRKYPVRGIHVML